MNKITFPDLPSVYRNRSPDQRDAGSDTSKCWKEDFNYDQAFIHLINYLPFKTYPTWFMQSLDELEQDKIKLVVHLLEHLINVGRVNYETPFMKNERIEKEIYSFIKEWEKVYVQPTQHHGV